ncbi:class I SAM-dependent methyltransferase [Pedobacter alpinus]|uniref:Class I SAM-dependent methyltransferase n=1 Tax=Pedobacter alpinus TaxID=1590643 RepID=A0ABW5TS29_9SPHI
MANELTDRLFWKNYWESKKDLIFVIPEKYVFKEIFDRLFKEQKINSVIELGGFPGYYATFLKKFYQTNTTLLDYFVYPELTQKLLQKNGLAEKDVAIIEADLFSHQPVQKYDLVLSCGLIEHFESTKSIITQHLLYLNDGGKLLITLPNFKGVNGFVQKTFDLENYNKHNIGSMNIQLLVTIAKDLGLKNVNAYYFGGFSVWLENKQQKSTFTKAFVKTIWYAGKLLTKPFGYQSRLFSPYIVLEATK